MVIELDGVSIEGFSKEPDDDVEEVESIKMKMYDYVLDLEKNLPDVYTHIVLERLNEDFVLDFLLGTRNIIYI